MQKEELSFYSKATTDIEFLFPLVGANFGVLLIELIMIYQDTWKLPKEDFNIL